MTNFIEWALAIIGGGGLGSAITYIINLNSLKKLAKAGADSAEIDVLLKRFDLHLDLCEYLLKTCDKYIKDYHELEGDFRKQMAEIRDQMDDILKEKSLAISDKCAEIATLKSQVTYLKGIRCYEFACTKRISTNPDKTE